MSWETARKWLHALAPWFAGACFVAAAVLVGRTVHRLGPAAIADAVRGVEATQLLTAVGFTAASYATLTLFDWLAVRTVADETPTYPRVALASFTALSVGHTVGLAALSSGTIRYRFYLRYGLPDGKIAGVILFSGATVAAGLAGVAGLGAVTTPEAVAGLAGVSPALAAWSGGAALAAVAAYVAATALLGRDVRVFGKRLPVPSTRVALLQVGVGCLNFVLVAGALHALLGEATDVGWLSFASHYAVGNALAILSHVPGGLGVLEAVVLAAVPGADALGALILFRLTYYVTPFVLGAAAYAAFELAGRRASRGARG